MDGSPPPVNAAAVLLQLQRAARHAETPAALRFLMVNDTRRLLGYRQAVLALGPPRALRIAAVAGVATLDRDAPMVRWLERVVRRLAEGGTAAECRPLDPAALPPGERTGWAEWSAPFVLWCPLTDRGGALLGGLWLARETAWTDPERVLAAELADAYAHAWTALAGPAARRRGRPARRAAWAGLLAALLAVQFMPVHLSALAPAEIVPIDPLAVAAPLNGVIAAVQVQPNQPVARGQPLFSMVDVELRARRDVAERALAVAEAEYRRAAQTAFADPRSSAQVAILAAQVDVRRAELAFAREQLGRVQVVAEQAGIAVFADPNDWIGRPVATGERIMLIADPALAEIGIRLAVGDAIVLAPGAAVELFLDTDPLRPLSGELTRIAYQAEPGPDGILAFRLKAALAPGTPPPRLGAQGTAKIYGERVPLFLYLFRRPIAALRQMAGF